MLRNVVNDLRPPSETSRNIHGMRVQKTFFNKPSDIRTALDTVTCFFLNPQTCMFCMLINMAIATTWIVGTVFRFALNLSFSFHILKEIQFHFVTAIF